MALLPSFFVLQSGGRYLSLTENIPDSLPPGFLKFDEEQIWSPRTKFAAEAAENGRPGLFHIRSVYNNKYLVTKQIESNSWIVASAKKPEEDTSKGASCTLFEPYSLPEDDDQSTVRLRHVGTGISATISGGRADEDTHNHQGVLLSSSTTTGYSSTFILTDSNSVLVLPSRLAFRSENLDSNYLGTTYLYDHLVYQMFKSEWDIGDLRVAKELTGRSDGSYYIKDLYTDLSWRRIDNWIKATVYTPDHDEDNIFSFVKIEDNVVGLRNLGNNAFCGAYTEDESINCLCAIYPTLSKETRLIVEEPIIRREIKDVEYRLDDSRIYDEQPVEINHSFVTNNLPTDNSMTVSKTITDSKTTSWNNSVSIQFGVKVEFEVALVPFIEESKVELSFEAGYSHEWGGEVTTENERTFSYTVTVSPFKTVKVTMLATTGKCDVPFSYTQRDLLPSGDWVETKKDDGLFKGLNSYDIHYKSEEVDPDDQEADTK